MTRVAADWRFVFSHPAHFIAFGSLVGIPLALWLLPAYGDIGYGIIVAIAFVLGCFACQITGRRLGVADYGGIVWDEVVAMMLVLWLVPLTPLWIGLAFLLFRFFDIVKLPPARYFDQHWKHGLGVMMDDIAAAAHTLIALALLKRIFG